MSNFSRRIKFCSRISSMVCRTRCGWYKFDEGFQNWIRICCVSVKSCLKDVVVGEMSLFGNFSLLKSCCCHKKKVGVRVNNIQKDLIKTDTENVTSNGNSNFIASNVNHEWYGTVWMLHNNEFSFSLLMRKI